jgi:hypothetical protein
MLGRAHRIDFARGASVPALAWALLVCGVIALTGAGFLLERQWQRYAAAMERADRLQSALARAAPPAPRKRDSAGATREAAAREEARQIWSALHRPWPALFNRLESVTGRERQLTQVAINANFTEALIQGEAANLEDAWRLAAELGAGAPVDSVQLLQHEWREGEDAPQVVAFRLRATLGPVRLMQSERGGPRSVALRDDGSEHQGRP